jgi:DNA primase
VAIRIPSLEHLLFGIPNRFGIYYTLALQYVKKRLLDDSEALRYNCGMAKKNPHAVALGRKGGKKSAVGRMKKLTAEQRREIARKAVEARWRKEKGDR